MTNASRITITGLFISNQLFMKSIKTHLYILYFRYIANKRHPRHNEHFQSGSMHKIFKCTAASK